MLDWPEQSQTSPTTTSLVKGGAYHIESTQPITAYQFNAYDYQAGGAYSYTNDASLLLPVEAMTGHYRVLAGASFGTVGNPTSQSPGLVAIVGTAAGTTVTFAMARGNLIAGAGLGPSGGTVTLNAGDVLQLASALDAVGTGFGSDMSGSLVTASAPVEVIGGQDCSYMPATAIACDHLEQTNLPLETLGTDYAVTMPRNANGPGRQYVKIIGTVNQTALTTSPAQSVPLAIGAGEVAFFEATEDFRLTSSQPVLVGQFMEGQSQFGSVCANAQGPNPDNCGDPSMSIAIPLAQLRDSYPFVAPPSYAENWVSVTAPVGATVWIDGVVVGGFGPPIGSSGLATAHVPLCVGGCDGSHLATGDQAFGIQVYGYGSFTSYMYPGGLNLIRQ